MISAKLASFVESTRYAGLPPEVREAACRCLLDWMGSAIRGSVEPPAQMFRDVAREEGGTASATALPDGWKTSAMWAAQINAAASHTMEMDDLHPSSVLHPAAPVISAAVAVGEALDATGEELVEAIVVGYEVAIRSGEAAGRSHYHFWHTTATCGTFGAAAATAKLLKLDRGRIVEAFGSAGTQAAGLWQFLEDGAMSKQLHPAHAAAAGILSAKLARQGFTAAKRIFEGEKGFLAAMSHDQHPHQLIDSLGKTYRILTNSFKKHASCRHTHTAIDAALRLREDSRIRAENIRQVEVRVYPASYDLLKDVRPTAAYAAKFSLPFTIAAALTRGRVSLAEFDDLGSADIRAVMSKVQVARDEALGAEYPEKWPAHVAVQLKSGECLAADVVYPKGDAKNPLTQVELEEKFRALTGSILSDRQQQHLIEISKNIGRHNVRKLWPF